MKCVRCACELDSRDIALTRKLVNRGATEFMCIHCLAEHFGVSEERLCEKIEEWKESGCTLFGGVYGRV